MFHEALAIDAKLISTSARPSRELTNDRERRLANYRRTWIYLVIEGSCEEISPVSQP